MKNQMEGLWDKLEIYCDYHADTGKPMKMVENTQKFSSPFYVCGTQAETGCPNRLNIDDLVGIVDKIGEMVSQDPTADLTNAVFKYKGIRHSIEVKILKYTSTKIKISIKNLTLRGGM